LLVGTTSWHRCVRTGLNPFYSTRLTIYTFEPFHILFVLPLIIVFGVTSERLSEELQLTRWQVFKDTCILYRYQDYKQNADGKLYCYQLHKRQVSSAFVESIYAELEDLQRRNAKHMNAQNAQVPFSS
jgi:hypothetical protein